MNIEQLKNAIIALHDENNTPVKNVRVSTNTLHFVAREFATFDVSITLYADATLYEYDHTHDIARTHENFDAYVASFNV